MNIDITTTFSPTKTRSYFSLKDSTPILLKSGVVYRFSCQGDPGTSYIGRFSRHLFKRISEHKKSGLQIASHIKNCCWCKDRVQPSFTVIDQSPSSNYDLSYDRRNVTNKRILMDWCTVSIVAAPLIEHVPKNQEVEREAPSEQQYYNMRQIDPKTVSVACSFS